MLAWLALVVAVIESSEDEDPTKDDESTEGEEAGVDE